MVVTYYILYEAIFIEMNIKNKKMVTLLYI